MTNADKIRAMTDEELATIIAENVDCGCCEYEFIRNCDCDDLGIRPCQDVQCYDFWVKWLKQEVSDNG